MLKHTNQKEKSSSFGTLSKNVFTLLKQILTSLSRIGAPNSSTICFQFPFKNCKTASPRIENIILVLNHFVIISNISDLFFHLLLNLKCSHFGVNSDIHKK